MQCVTPNLAFSFFFIIPPYPPHPLGIPPSSVSSLLNIFLWRALPARSLQRLWWLRQRPSQGQRLWQRQRRGVALAMRPLLLLILTPPSPAGSTWHTNVDLLLFFTIACDRRGSNAPRNVVTSRPIGVFRNTFSLPPPVKPYSLICIPPCWLIVIF